MENQLQKQEKTLLAYLAQGITKEGGIDVAGIDKIGVGMELKKFKNDRGQIEYGKLIKIPTENRIPAMAEKDMRGVVTTLAVAITMSLEVMNLKRGMNAIQIVDLAEAIVDDSGIDKIAIEDVLLFLQKLTRGEYGELYESLDSVKFMHHFNRYRDERWEEAIRIRDEKHENYKKEGGAREARQMTQFDNILQAYTTKLQAKNDEIKELRAQKNRQ
jgi:aryl carrier-like protein